MTKRLLSVLVTVLLLGLSAGLSAQVGVSELVCLRNDSVSVEIVSRFDPLLGRNPTNGTVRITKNFPLNYTLTYVADAGYLGPDDFLLVWAPLGRTVEFTNYSVSVQEAQIIAERDVAVATAGAPVTLDVVANDYVNTGTIELVSAPVTNGGTAEVVDGQIRFTPAPGFSGLADFNYVVCTREKVCDLGTATVVVEPAAAAEVPDTIRVFTKRNEAQFILAAAGATQTAAPASGSVTTGDDGVMRYVPEEDFVGDDFVTYASAAGTTVFHLTVLDLATNRFAVEDRASTTPGAAVRFNVLTNDTYGGFADCVSYGAPRFGSLQPTGRNGEVVYTPPTGWSGVDYFTYASSAPGCVGPSETQTVYITVTDYAPEAETTALTVPAGTPVRITYPVPGAAADWEVISGPTAGSLTADGAGQLVYTGAAPGTDRVSLRYCPDGNAGCTTVVAELTVTAAPTDGGGCTPGDDCVWPGDTNNDGVVDVADLLPIGLAMGEFGTPRPVAAPAAWGAQYSEDWEQSVNGRNLKHADANGDRVISHLDTQVVRANLGRGHRLRTRPLNYVDFELSLVGDFEAEPGDLVRLGLYAGSDFVVVEDLIGFSVRFRYEPAAVRLAGFELSENSWAAYDSPVLSIVDNDAEAGTIDAAFTRTSGVGASGYGTLGAADFVVVEDLIGFIEDPDGPEDAVPATTITLGGGTAEVMNAAGHSSAVRVHPAELTIRRRPATDVAALAPTRANDYLDAKLLAFPNPTADRLTVHLNGQQRFTELRLTDLTGRTVLRETGLDTNHRELNLGGVRRGVYTLTLMTTDGVVNRKVEVLR